MREVPSTHLEGLTRYAEPAEAMVRGNEVTLFLPPTGMSTGNLTGKSLPVKLPGVFPVGMGNPPRGGSTYQRAAERIWSTASTYAICAINSAKCASIMNISRNT
jgi:hypothetical protein